MALTPEFVAELQASTAQVGEFNLCTLFLRKFESMLESSDSLFQALKGDTDDPILIMVGTGNATVQFEIPTLTIPWKITPDTMSDVADAVASGDINVCGEGRWLDQVCWYFGEAGKDCNEVCAVTNKRYDSKTKSFAGSAGTLDQCITLGSEFGVSVGSTNGDGWCYSDGTGCNTDSQYGGHRCRSETTAAAKYNTARRFCACKSF